MSRINKISTDDAAYMKGKLCALLEQRLNGWEPEVDIIYQHNHDFYDVETIRGFYDDFVFKQKGKVIEAAILACVNIAKHGDLHMLPQGDAGLFLLHQAIDWHPVHKSVWNKSKPRPEGYYNQDFWLNTQVVAWLICVVWDWYTPLTYAGGKGKWIELAAKRAYDEQPPSRWGDQ